ncbi:LysE family translocator [Nocardia shimofusensis]|uniref:LysE family translocator n=1 Tax=Nocardia shimofusensis TaxID=228596 RepID=UPI0008325E5F|nr:LysE family translocator [Nocardia shimofusensis]
MVTWSQWVTFAGLAFVMVALPGPSVLFTIGRALTVGRRAALLTVVGNSAGVYAQVVAVAFGLGAVVTASATVFTAIKLAGALYLVYLGIQAIRQRAELAGVLGTDGVAPAFTTRRVLRDGFVVGVANPKSIVFLTALLPQVVDPGRGAVTGQVLVLGLCIPAFALFCDSGWALAAGTARAWLAGTPRRLAAVGGAGGLVLIGLGASLALTGRKD